MTKVVLQKIRISDELVNMDILDRDIKDMHYLIDHIILKNVNIYFPNDEYISKHMDMFRPKDKYYQHKLQNLGLDLKRFIDIIQDQPVIKNNIENSAIF